ncbi:ABC transporter substrate-binding protein [Natribacillus halophilus]|uniref:Amino acid/amide ABC transporter substrate-binding protein, HAAT family n=1 Tax=Natribacillus halophilus TaxID=549003 RepID=A0A1G8KGH5_9BACI|nr:ABC transporter substrate-binding protein [Natribacillus halophilus]SDI42492.1 amino acid/amide ABC transporter substrate-binding protein, HAAT family [Natribacillus halophilus]
MNKKFHYFLFTVPMVFVLAIATACAEDANDDDNNDGEAAEEEMSIGLVGPMTGGFADYGEKAHRGVELALDEVDNTIAGYEVNLVVEDSQADAEQLTTSLDSLHQRDEVDVIIGPSTGDEGEAAASWAQDHEDVLIMPGYSAAEDMTMRAASDNLIRAGWTGTQTIYHFGKFVHDELGHDRIAMVGQNYAYPWDQAAGFKRGFYENGGEEVHTIWHETDILDFSSIMNELQSISDDYDAVLLNSGGADTIAFWGAWEQYGMGEYYPQLLGGTNVADIPILEEVTDNFEGVYSSMHYSEDLDHEENMQFRENYADMHDEEADGIALQGYDTMRVIIDALETTGGDTSDVNALTDEIMAMEVDDSPRGSFYFDEYGQAVQDIYIKEVQMVDGELENQVIDTYEEVSQFGPYEGLEEEYMEQPNNSADFPADTAEEYFEELEEYFGQEYIDELEENDGWE